MKEGFIVSKSAVSEDELTKINALTRREMSADELYTFSVLLCDNDIDRDFEKFSVKALSEMAPLFIGKTGIFDHDMSADNQSARIYDCFVETDSSKKTVDGEMYHKLIAKAYMPKTAKNADLIAEIESGIKKEVSVGCSVQSMICSICGEDMRTHRCEHIKGKEYCKNGVSAPAHAILDGVSDVYEWSFVAVPAQRNAGVIKNFVFNASTDCTPEKLSADERTVISKSKAEQINRLIDSYEALKEELAVCKEELSRDINLMLGEENESMRKAFSVTAKKMSAGELILLKKELTDKKASDDAGSQFRFEVKNRSKSKNQGFII